MFDEDEYDESCLDQFREYLDRFQESLRQSGISTKTIREHVKNMDLYLTMYLPRKGVKSASEGIYFVRTFFEYFLIRKVMNSSPFMMKSCGTSLRKFYKFMLDLGEVSQEDYKDMCKEIKEKMPRWIDMYHRFMSLDEYSLLWSDPVRLVKYLHGIDD